MSFVRPYDVAEFIAGYRDSPIWIVGLNPAEVPNWEEKRTVDELQEKFVDVVSSSTYFRNFARVSEWLYSRMGKEGGVAHTDLIKCSSKAWPPTTGGSGAVAEVISNCSPFLLQQIALYRPRMIICNGAEVSKFVQTVIQPDEPTGQQTSYRGKVNGSEIWVVLSGFIGRIDNFARLRLGKEIERIALEIGIKT